jgi:hypothetical protein
MLNEEVEQISDLGFVGANEISCLLTTMNLWQQKIHLFFRLIPQTLLGMIYGSKISSVSFCPLISRTFLRIK